MIGCSTKSSRTDKLQPLLSNLRQLHHEGYPYQTFVEKVILAAVILAKVPQVCGSWVRCGSQTISGRLCNWAPQCTRCQHINLCRTRQIGTPAFRPRREQRRAHGDASSWCRRAIAASPDVAHRVQGLAGRSCNIVSSRVSRYLLNCGAVRDYVPAALPCAGPS